MSNQHATIKAATGFRTMKPDAVFSTSQAIYNALNGNANIPAPPAPFDLPTLLAANQALSAANSAALDGGKMAVAQRNHCKEVVVKLLDQLATYVQANCKEDMTIFVSSGFKAQSSTKTVSATASESIRYVKPGPNSGQVQVKLVVVRIAGSYEVRWAPVAAGGVATAWTTQPVLNVRSATVVSGLTPGTTYAFQARAVIPSGYTDWSDSVTQMATQSRSVAAPASRERRLFAPGTHSENGFGSSRTDLGIRERIWEFANDFGSSETDLGVPEPRCRRTAETNENEQLFVWK